MSIKDLQAKLDRQEAKEVTGAPLRLPKEQMLDAKDVEARNPDKHLRWINLREQSKVQSRLADGYVRLDQAAGGRSLGDEMALFAIPTAAYEARIARQEQAGKERLSQHNREWERQADGIAKELRDRHGLNVDASSLTQE